jgi:hypothetical protein
MHGMLGLAGLLGLIAFAFGERTAVAVARVLIGLGLAVGLWLAFMIVGERL